MAETSQLGTETPQVSRPEKKKKHDPHRKGPETVYDENGNWTVFQHQDQLRAMENQLFTSYYRDIQKLVPADAWPALAASLREPLPTTIWINDTDTLAPQVSAFFESLDSDLVQPITWYPIKGMAWRILADKATFRKRPDMQPLRRYLVHQTALGTISRQEEVSMIPPFLLDIQPTDVCLDMCASPGSKTAQMLVALGRHKKVADPSASAPFPFDYLSEGLIMANELDTKRANMLVHQCKRMRLLFPFALFANHDARYFPDLTLSGAEEVRFDKILCDVVCSGDGTIRKAPFIFKVWTPREALQLQCVQVQIALRACHLLKVGGRLVYSTCSLNPIENEAVVCQIARRTNGAMRLVDARNILPDLSCDPGLTSWSVTDPKGNVVEAPSDVFHPALFPPNIAGSDGLPPDFDLTKCMRLLPRHCNGGGFFIAVFDKVSEFRIAARESAEQEAVEKEKQAKKNEANRKKQLAKRGRAIDGETTPKVTAVDSDAAGEESAERKEKPKKLPVVPPQFLPATEAMVRSLKLFYQLGEAFPVRNLLCRAGQGERSLSVGINTTASLVSNSALRILQGKGDNLIIVSAGLRILAYENLDKGWRIASEAAPLFTVLLKGSSRLLHVTRDIVETLMQGGKLKDILLEDLPSPLRDEVESLSVGTVMLQVECPSGPMLTTALRARTRLQLLVDHEDIDGLRLRLGLPVSDSASVDVPDDNDCA